MNINTDIRHQPKLSSILGIHPPLMCRIYIHAQKIKLYPFNRLFEFSHVLQQILNYSATPDAGRCETDSVVKGSAQSPVFSHDHCYPVLNLQLSTITESARLKWYCSLLPDWTNHLLSCSAPSKMVFTSKPICISVITFLYSCMVSPKRSILPSISTIFLLLKNNFIHSAWVKWQMTEGRLTLFPYFRKGARKRLWTIDQWI